MNAETMLLQIHQIQLIYASAVRGAIRQSACSHVHCFDIPINHCMSKQEINAHSENQCGFSTNCHTF